MGNASHGCCGQRFNFLIRAIFSCIHPKHLQGHTKTLAFSRREGFFLDFNRREEINGRGFLGRCRTAGDSHPSLPAAAELRAKQETAAASAAEEAEVSAGLGAAASRYDESREAMAAARRAMETKLADRVVAEVVGGMIVDQDLLLVVLVVVEEV